ncbi:MAG TPA: glucosaminidase domain-containing protein [Ferruginibacter sp.]|nr:glucosaminidase domain-containing protein [Ferruginibacter sp.]
MAEDLSQKWGIPASIILGVSTLESGSGTSLNCKQLNNYFGVKGRNHLKKRHTKYKQYASAEASFADFCGILSRKRFYPKMKNNMDYHLWLKEMNKSKYSSAQEVWVHRIKVIISEYELYKLDQKQAESDNSVPSTDPGAPPPVNKSSEQNATAPNQNAVTDSTTVNQGPPGPVNKSSQQNATIPKPIAAADSTSVPAPPNKSLSK